MNNEVRPMTQAPPAPQVVYEDYIQLKYQLTSDLKVLTENVNRLTSTVEKKFDHYDEKFVSINNKCTTNHAKKATTEPAPGSSSLSPSLRWLLIVILGVAFLGTLGAAIGINLLESVGKIPKM